ncbi:MAG: hypothetical protein JSS79_21010 [Bacteroidetes bacterium]|nr:hypothetical protein [Bacteroidota bacterium]
MRSALISVSFIFLLASCSKNEATPPKNKGARQVAVHITQAEGNSYDTEFNRVKSLGIDVVPFTIPWTMLETGSGFDFSILDIINYYYPAHSTKVSINLTPIYAVSRALPSDLQAKAFNDPLVIARFKTLIDSVHKRLAQASINNFVLGLEVDNYLNNHQAEWSAYKAFYDSAGAYIKKRWGAAMPVGVETTWSSAAYNSKENIISLNQHSDMMVLSYYPNQSDFTVKPPTAVHADVEAIIALYPSMPVFIIETGYQTSASCNSSDEMQKQFIIEMFKLWDLHSDKINFIGFLWLTDLSDQVVAQYVTDYNASGFPSLNAFKGYLQTTGLRTYAGGGTDKPAFTQLKSELASRGW